MGDILGYIIQHVLYWNSLFVPNIPSPGPVRCGREPGLDLEGGVFS